MIWGKYKFYVALYDENTMGKIKRDQHDDNPSIKIFYSSSRNPGRHVSKSGGICVSNRFCEH